ncbi:alpha-ketoacid dehydrogenase subunit beta [Anoxynatronum buryatiense]|uniref:Pyruvate dehydrogenase E1 component beta subunit n=1 Tax=Anoxynatronum buryatiense TaxID=489973 RepID=A0AA45WXT5_9CLOT|nr:alpha-ketoacid dehydrogenase subunit beta [Anoxynatronum buryatiense]SMP63940.1 pyruvate dehydrogenase E1 component beta subunit [Anoxynatronum buryatiense]
MRQLTFSQAVLEAQMEEMEKDQHVFIIGEDVAKMGSAFGQCAGLYDRFGPNRVFNMPVAESGYANFGVGAAMAGKRPIVEMQFADFIVYAFDAVGNQGPKQRYMSGGELSVPMTIRAPQGAGFGAAAQHSQCVEAWFMNFPGLKIVMPSNPHDAKGLLKTAIQDNDPVLFLEHKQLLGMKGDVPEGEYTIPLGQASVVREGKDVTIIALQAMVYPALEAATELADEGIDVEIIDPRSLIPLDKKTLAQSVKKTGRVIIVHEAPKRGGFGGEISAVISEEFFPHLKAPIKRLGAANIPLPFGMPEQYCLPNKVLITECVKELMNPK